MIARNPILWICRIVSSLILLQTLYFKFSAAEESVYIFTMVDMEPYGRYATGIVELLAAVLIIIPKTSLYGAFLALTVMLGAIGSHLFILGLEVMNDGGQLFIYSLVVSLCCLIIIYGYTKRVKPEP
jgi:hypothetical protein